MNFGDRVVDVPNFVRLLAVVPVHFSIVRVKPCSFVQCVGPTRAMVGRFCGMETIPRLGLNCVTVTVPYVTVGPIVVKAVPCL